MVKTIDLSRPIHDICIEYPEVAGIMRELGFRDITKPGMLNTAGRFMTIPKGAAMKGISLDIIKEAFKKEGFELQERRGSQ
ncbi:MAG: DUF1858 domain-containing protein [Clostridiales bacterium]|nr:DUF1858 domain-containing protein [Clostridiales bacterium]